MTSNVIERFGAVQSAYELNRDIIKQARRAVRGDPIRAGSSLLVLRPEELEREFDSLNDRLADVTVLNLWVAFERFLIDHITWSTAPLSSLPSEFASALQAKLSHEVERWRFEEMLDLYKGWVDSRDVGWAKQIKSYRDWIAHRNPKKPPPALVDPDTAYRVLAGFVRAVESAQGSG